MIKFGPAGNCKTFYDDGFKRTIEAPKWLSGKGLDAYEYSFGKGFTLPDETRHINLAPFCIHFMLHNILILQHQLKKWLKKVMVMCLRV